MSKTDFNLILDKRFKLYQVNKMTLMMWFFGEGVKLCTIGVN